MGSNKGIHKIVDDRDFDNFSIDDNEIGDDLAEFDIEHGITNNSNSDIDYYPGMEGGRHAFLGEAEDFKTKAIRLSRKFFMELTSQKSRKLVVGVVGIILVISFFALTLFAGSGSDSDLPGGAIHDGKQPNGDLQKTPADDNSGSEGSGDNLNESPELVKLSLDDMRQGSYWVFDSAINFFDYQEPKKSEKRDGHDDDEDDDSDDDSDDEDDDDDDKKDKEGKHKQDDKEKRPSKDNKKSDSKKIATSGDLGYFIQQEGDIVNLKKAADTDFTQEILDLSKLTYDGVALQANIVSFTKSLDKIIVSSERRNHWRHSSFAKYWLVDSESLAVEPIHYTTTKKDGKESITPVTIAYAAFAPDGDNVYYHYNGNLYLKNIRSNTTKVITSDGDTKNIFNGKPDWVYEEEVLASDRAIYWEETGSKFAFIKWDDTEVPVYNLEIFGDENYPKVTELKYPKPGYANAKLTLMVYDVTKDKLIEVKQPEEQDSTVESLGKDFIIYQTVWLNENELLFKRTDRTSRKIQVCCFDVKNSKTRIVRSVNTDDYEGWYKNNGNIYVLPDNKGYIDNVVVDNNDHLSHFKSADDAEGELVTSGDWNVIGGVVGYDTEENTIYFIGTHGNALQRQIYKVKLDESALFGLTDLDSIHSYSLKTSKSGKWGVVKYAGPELPYQKIVELQKFTEDKYIESLPNLNNAEVVDDLLQGYEVPSKEYISISMGDGEKINVIEVKPKNFDESKKYPILVSVYGGPGIQKVSCDFSYGFEEIVASQLDAIVLYIDPRGTGGSSWKYRSWARNKIGYWEPRDIVETTQSYINDRDYVDMEKVAIWGWSYGGFTTLKTLEYDNGVTFKFGMAVAPVTNWYLYDSIYTERYMGFPSDENVYQDSKISEYNNFKNIYRFLVMHGTGDDNVHYQNTLQLLNRFDINGVENYDVHIFPDSDHNISHDNANTIVYDKLFNWLSMVFEV